LTAFVGSIITGLSSGAYYAFMGASVAWFGTLRLLLSALWRLAEVFFGSIPVRDEAYIEGLDTPGFWAWLSWSWSAIWSPVIQTLWLVENWKEVSGGVEMVRGFGLLMSAYSLTIHTFDHYKLNLSKKLGSWMVLPFACLTALSCLTLGTLSVIELLHGLIKLHPTNEGTIFIIAWCSFLQLTGCMSLMFANPGGDPPEKTWSGVLAGFFAGAFAGLFIATPAYVLMTDAPKSPGSSLDIYLRCKSVSLWKKLVAVVP